MNGRRLIGKGLIVMQGRGESRCSGVLLVLLACLGRVAGLEAPSSHLLLLTFGLLLVVGRQVLEAVGVDVR